MNQVNVSFMGSFSGPAIFDHSAPLVACGRGPLLGLPLTFRSMYLMLPTSAPLIYL